MAEDSITPLKLEALCDHLLEKPSLYLDEMAVFLWDEFQTPAMTSSIKRALASQGWSKKTTQQRAKEQNADLGEFYLHNLSDFQLYHLVYVDESGVINGFNSDEQAGHHLVWPLCKCHSSTAMSDIRYSLHMSKME